MEDTPQELDLSDPSAIGYELDADVCAVPGVEKPVLSATLSGRKYKQIQYNAMSRQYEVIRGQPLTLKISNGEPGNFLAEVSLHHADPLFSRNIIQSEFMSMPFEITDAMSTHSVKTETRWKTICRVSGETSRVKINFNTFSSCRVNTGGRVAARNWMLRIKTSNGAVKIPIQVMNYLRDPVTRLRRKRRLIPDQACDAVPINDYADIPDDKWEKIWEKLEKQDKTIETMSDTVSRMEEKLDKLITKKSRTRV